LMREAVNKALMLRQRKIWEMYNYDRLTHEEIAKKLGVTRSAITQQIKVIENRITKWVKKHSEVYNTLSGL